MKLESAIQAEIIAWLQKRPNSVTYKHPPNPSGMPDIAHFENGIPYFFEVKRTAKDKPRKLQLYRHDKLSKAGCIVNTVHSLKQVKKVIL